MKWSIPTQQNGVSLYDIMCDYTRLCHDYAAYCDYNDYCIILTGNNIGIIGKLKSIIHDYLRYDPSIQLQ